MRGSSSVSRGRALEHREARIIGEIPFGRTGQPLGQGYHLGPDFAEGLRRAAPEAADRKSTRLNSSHRCISYAVFCLKKKRDREERPGQVQNLVKRLGDTDDAD